MIGAKQGNFRKIALASLIGAVFLQYFGVLGGWDISPKPLAMTADVAVATTEKPVRAKVKKLYQRNPEVVALDQYFKSIGYTLEDATHVPRIYINRVPKGLRDLASVDERKRIFLRIMLPLSLKVNEEISANRERLLSIRRNEYSGIAPTPSEKEWIDGLMKKYRISEGGTAALLERIDVIPPSLMLAQSAEESGWGTSRFVRNGNALFGQWAWNEDEGIVPENREEGKTHVIKAFDSLMDSVRAYARNINSHPAYAGLRQARADMRASGQDITGWELANSLTQYSERGAEYVDSLHAIMKVNNLNDFDHLEFGGDDVAPPPGLLASLQD